MALRAGWWGRFRGGASSGRRPTGLRPTGLRPTGLRPAHLRRPRPAPLVARDVLVGRRRGDQVADDVERDVLEPLEAHAALPHVELQPGAREAVAQATLVLRVHVHAHEVQRVVTLLRGERDVAERPLVVRVGIARQRHLPRDAAPRERLLVAVGHAAAYGVAHRGHDRATLHGKRGEILGDGRGGGHGVMSGVRGRAPKVCVPDRRRQRTSASGTVARRRWLRRRDQGGRMPRMPRIDADLLPPRIRTPHHRSSCGGYGLW